VSDESIDKYLVGDVDDEMFEEEGENIAPPVIVPPASDGAQSQAAATMGTRDVPTQSAPAPRVPDARPRPETAPAPRPTSDREARLAEALERLMHESPDVEASALVSLDGFIIASALPEGMQEDRVGAMSAAILALGERAAAELGRGQLTQVFIEGADGYVLLVAAGGRAVLTVLARREAKLGLVLYDMRAAADTIAETLH
jgi:uncharacterized protein